MRGGSSRVLPDRRIWILTRGNRIGSLGLGQARPVAEFSPRRGVAQPIEVGDCEAMFRSRGDAGPVPRVRLPILEQARDRRVVTRTRSVSISSQDRETFAGTVDPLTSRSTG